MKVLKVSIDIPSAVKSFCVSRCQAEYQPHNSADTQVKRLVADSANDAYDRLIQPMLTRGFRFVCLYRLMLFLVIFLVVTYYCYLFSGLFCAISHRVFFLQ